MDPAPNEPARLVCRVGFFFFFVLVSDVSCCFGSAETKVWDMTPQSLGLRSVFGYGFPVFERTDRFPCRGERRAQKVSGGSNYPQICSPPCKVLGWLVLLRLLFRPLLRSSRIRYPGDSSLAESLSTAVSPSFSLWRLLFPRFVSSPFPYSWFMAMLRVRSRLVGRIRSWNPHCLLLCSFCSGPSKWPNDGLCRVRILPAHKRILE